MLMSGKALSIPERRSLLGQKISGLKECSLFRHSDPHQQPHLWTRRLHLGVPVPPLHTHTRRAGHTALRAFARCGPLCLANNEAILFYFTQNSAEVAQSFPTLCNPTDYIYSSWNSPGQNTGVGSLFLLQGIFPPRDRTQVSRIAGGFFTSWATNSVWELIQG